MIVNFVPSFLKMITQLVLGEGMKTLNFFEPAVINIATLTMDHMYR